MRVKKLIRKCIKHNEESLDSGAKSAKDIVDFLKVRFVFCQISSA